MGTDEASAPRVVLEGGTKLSRALIKDRPLVIGQSRECDFRIPHPSLAASHCKLTWGGGSSVLLATSGEHSLEVNGEDIGGQTRIRGGDRFAAGLFTLRLEMPGSGEGEPDGSAEGVSSETGPSAGTERPVPDPLPTVQFRGKAVSEIPLRGRLVLGTAESADVRLEGGRVSPEHAVIEPGDSGFEVIDQGEVGSLMNGKYFDRHLLTIGDFLNIGEHWFAYDGFALCCVQGATGCGLSAADLRVERGKGRTILDGASFRARPGQFVGILGPSGAGKTTLLKALSGLSDPTLGRVEIDGRPMESIEDLSDYLGFVPQQEIVHLELTARQALYYSALLRLPKRTPLREIGRLIDRITSRLGLSAHLDTPAGNLSGGQLKRLSVCVELLSRPSILFLDEPTSGLDPETETELMQQLQELTYTGCTVVATTHLMENVYLMNSIEVVMAGRDEETGQSQPGTTVFRGRPRLAKDFFGVANLTRLYGKLKEQPRDDWLNRFRDSDPDGGEVEMVAEPVSSPRRRRRRRRQLRRRWSVPILMRRQWTILRSSPMNLMLLLGQPTLIALLIAVVASAEATSATELFLAYIATLWLGCSNAATEIVREKSVFFREQFVGLGTAPYLISKFVGMGLLTGLQALLMYAVLSVARGGLEGSALWQVGCLLGCAAASTGIGLAVSAWARTSLQAVLMVPVLIIPQILFAGFVFPVQDWNEAPLPRVVSRVVPSFAAQRVMDTSLLWERKISNYFDLEEEGLNVAYDNLSTTLYPSRTLWRFGAEFDFQIDERKLYRVDPEARRPIELGVKDQTWSPENPPSYRLGVIFRHWQPGVQALVVLLGWMAATFGLSWILLRRSQSP